MSQREYLLESEENAETISSLVDYLRGFTNEIDGKFQAGDKYFPVMGSLKDLLVATAVYGYDLPELKTKHPVGFHTENALMFSSDILDKITYKYGGETYISKVKAQVIFSSMLLDMVEDLYSVHFDAEQRKQINNEIFKVDSVKTFDSMEIHEAREQFENMLPRANFVSWKELTEIAQQAGIKADYEKRMGTSNETLNTALFRTTQLHNPEHVLHAISDKVIHAEALKNIPDLNPSLEEFEKYANKGSDVESRAYALEVLNHQLEKVIKKVQKNNLTDNEVVVELKDRYIPLLSFVDPETFITSLQNLTRDLLNGRPDPLPHENERKLNEKVLKEINEIVPLGSIELGKAIRVVTNYTSVAPLKR